MGEQRKGARKRLRRGEDGRIDVAKPLGKRRGGRKIGKWDVMSLSKALADGLEAVDHLQGV
jgi:hypothetical protein